MPKNLKRFLFFKISILTVLLFFLISGCSTDKKEINANQTDISKDAEIISTCTSGTIAPDSKIRVTFVKASIPDELSGKSPEEQFFFFEPEVRGKTVWKNSRTAIFVPEKPLEMRTKYKCRFVYGKILKQYGTDTSCNFTFTTSGREVKSLDSDFIPYSEDPGETVLKGVISFTVNTDINDIEENTALTGESGYIKLKWKKEDDGKTFSFISEKFTRPQKTAGFLFRITGNNLNLSKDFEKTLTLESVKNFKIMHIFPDSVNEKPCISMKFSDGLDMNQDITGLIRVEPQTRFNVKREKNLCRLIGDFSHGNTYKVKIFPLKSKWGVKMKKEASYTIIFEDKKPQISFLSKGVFLPETANCMIDFKTMNLKRVKITVLKVFTQNLCQFLQTEKLASAKNRSDEFNSYNTRRVGIPAGEKILEIGNRKNIWLTSRIDMKKILRNKERGIYLVKINFTRKDMLYNGLEKKSRYYYGREYYTNPNSSGYLWKHGSVHKGVIYSNIALTYKRGTHGNHLVFATDTVSAEPLRNVKITLKSFQNQTLGTGTTDSKGEVRFHDIERKVFFITGSNADFTSVIVPSEMAWNTSSFETSGAEGHLSSKSIKAFIYCERGVYRPGDEINISALLRNQTGTFPENHPVSLRLYNPKNQLVLKKISKRASDGFYTFKINTKNSDLTGNWRAVINAGTQNFSKTIKIETIAPFRLKIKISSNKPKYRVKDREVRLKIESSYLFGAPGAGLKTDTRVTLRSREKKSAKFPGFKFTNELVKFLTLTRNVSSDNLNDKGEKEITWGIPPLTESPGCIQANFITNVYEKGGRATRKEYALLIDPFDSYTGIQKPEMKYGYASVGNPLKFNTVLTDREGNNLKGRKLKYTIYKNSRYWWWEYDSISNFKSRYKKDTHTKIVKQGYITTDSSVSSVTFTPETRGEYFLEISEDRADSHKAGTFFSAYMWGDSPNNNDSESLITLKSDKKTYSPGSKAKINIPVTGKALVYLTLEKAGSVIKTMQIKADSAKESVSTEIDITEEMIPNVYITASVIQPYMNSANDRPLRTYGIIPLLVESADTKRKLIIEMPDELKSNKEFSVKVRTADKKPAQLTLAVVDEGLLGITDFQTPDPWKFFFKKERLSILTYDLFSHIIGAPQGDVFKLFSIGGDIESEKYRKSQTEDSAKTRRFVPVSFFRGPVKTDKNGTAQFKIKMPNYIGAVRAMAVCADRNSYASAEKSVVVKTDLMVLPTLPRVLGPSEEITVPVSVFSMNKKIKGAEIKIEATGPCRITGPSEKKIKFTGEGEEEVFFKLKTLPATGPCKIKISCSSGKYKSFKTTELMVRASSPRLYKSETVKVKKDSEVKIKINGAGLPGTNNASIVIAPYKKLNIKNRLYWLMKYPYGCIEQTTSAVFPQLFLKNFIKQGIVDEEKIDENINSAIKRLTRFRTASGGFSYWPGGTTPSLWGTTYAGHFMIKAKEEGYSVPDDLFNAWLNFQKKASVRSDRSLLSQVYRLYVLALAGSPQIGPMNLIKENNLQKLSNTSKWLLASTYYLSGRKKEAKEISAELNIKSGKYVRPGLTYGSSLRDKAIIMTGTLLMDENTYSDQLYEEIVSSVASERWYSTQTLGFSLMALGDFMKKNNINNVSENFRMKGYIKIPGQKKVKFDTEKRRFELKIKEGFGKEAEIYMDEDSSSDTLYVTSDWNGVPLMSETKDIAENLDIKIAWKDRNGFPVDISSLKQGTEFWAHIRVSTPVFRKERLEEMALVQIFPSGWEIENTRLLSGNTPSWASKYYRYYDYTDIRDDRVMWFFDMPYGKKSVDFLVKLRSVTAGKFYLPDTVAESMYSRKYQAVRKGKSVEVLR